MNRLKEVFSNVDSSEKVMSLFLTAGYPAVEETVDLVQVIENAGADLIELGMPFSDPLADGPTIQYSSEVALKNGITIKKVIQTVGEIRKKSQIPIVLMGYLNPVLRYGLENFCRDAAGAGVDALILPDVPVEESELVEQYSKKYNLSLIYLIAPNTSDERMKLIDERSDGFVYCVSVTGVTGARSGKEVEDSVNRFIDRVNKNITKNPVMIGFGIKTHEDAMKISSGASGFIVGSALIDCIRKNYPNPGWKENVIKFVRDLKYGKTDS